VAERFLDEMVDLGLVSRKDLAASDDEMHRGEAGSGGREEQQIEAVEEAPPKKALTDRTPRADDVEMGEDLSSVSTATATGSVSKRPRRKNREVVPVIELPPVKRGLQESQSNQDKPSKRQKQKGKETVREEDPSEASEAGLDYSEAVVKELTPVEQGLVGAPIDEVCQLALPSSTASLMPP
jgi:hypothetical protein